MNGRMLLAVNWRPLGLPPAVLGGILVIAGLALFVHYNARVRRKRAGTPPRPHRFARALFATRRLRLAKKPPFLRMETTDEQWTIMGTDAELYWAIALFTAGVGSLLAV